MGGSIGALGFGGGLGGGLLGARFGGACGSGGRLSAAAVDPQAPYAITPSCLTPELLQELQKGVGAPLVRTLSNGGAGAAVKGAYTATAAPAWPNASSSLPRQP